MSEVKVALRQYRAELVAEFSLKQRLERIAWEEEVMKEALAKKAREIGATGTYDLLSVGSHEDN